MKIKFNTVSTDFFCFNKVLNINNLNEIQSI